MKTKNIRKIISLVLVLVLCFSLFTVPASAIGLESTLATIGGLTNTGVATLTSALSGLGITVGGVALAVAGGVAVALLIRHISMQLSAEQIAELNTGEYTVDADLLRAIDNVIAPETEVSLSNPYEWQLPKYGSTLAGSWSAEFISQYVQVLPFLVVSDIQYNAYDGNNNLISSWETFDPDMVSSSAFVRFCLDLTLTNTFSGQTYTKRQLVFNPQVSTFGVPDIPAVDTSKIYAYRYGSSSSVPYYTAFVIGMFINDGIQTLKQIGSTGSWKDDNPEYLIPIYPGQSTPATMPIDTIAGLTISGSTGALADGLTGTYERDNTIGAVGTVLTPPAEYERDFVLNPDGSVSISNDLVLNPTIPEEETWLDRITGTITGAIDSVIEAITSPFGDLSEFVDGIAEYFGNIDGIGGLFNHYLPVCVATYAFIGFMILLAFWILRMILNR